MKLLLLSAALLLAQADAGVAERRVKITVRAIAASNDAAIPAGTDPKLKPIGPQLESFGEQFRFRSYRLIDERSFDLDWKNAAEVELPGSRSLQVTPRQLDADGKIKVQKDETTRCFLFPDRPSTIEQFRRFFDGEIGQLVF